MTTPNEIKAKNQALLKRQEGYSSKLYRDSVGKWTIGWGRNIDDKGIRQDEAELMFQHDYEDAMQDLHAHAPWTMKLDPVRHEVMVNMCFNMGWGDGRRGLSTFVNTMRAVREGRYADAAKGMANSKWATQVGSRAKILARMMETGAWSE